MNSFLEKARLTTESTAFKLGVRSNSAWNRIKLNKQIIELRSEMSKGYKKLAHRYYDMWIAENVDFDEIDGICQSILNKEDRINGIKMEIRELVQKEREKIERWKASKEKPVTSNVVRMESSNEEDLPIGNGVKPEQNDDEYSSQIEGAKD